MAIDPLLYEKISGRKGDPHQRLGEALAKSARAPKKDHYGDAPEESGYTKFGLAGFYGLKWQAWISMIGALVVLGVIISAFFVR